MIKFLVSAALAASLSIVPLHGALAQAPVEPDEYRIGPADVLRISVWNEPELSGTVPVRPDGMISLPLLNDVRAAGRTPLALREHLIEQLGYYMPAPEVSVVVEEVRSYTVSVLGQVNEPGRYELHSHATVLEVIAEAGGFTEFASPSRIVILRNENGVKRRINFNYNQVVSRRGSPEANIVLKPGDVVVVS